jgi:hypothetical protein
MRMKSSIVLLLAIAAFSSVGAQSQKPEIVLDFTLPNGATPQIRLTDGGVGTIQLADAGKFGFVPTLQKGEAGVVIVEVFDMNRTPDRRIARLELIVGGEAKQLATTPRFGVRVSRVATR